MWNWVRACKAAALLAFLLPWVTISCSSQKIATASGVDLARGSLTVINPISRVTEDYQGSANAMLIAAIVAILAGLLFTFTIGARRGNAMVPLATSVVALLLCIAGTARIDSRSVGAAAAKREGGFDANIADSIIRVDYAYGFWVTILALAGAAFFAWQIWQSQRRRGPVAVPVHASNEPLPPG